MAVSINRDMDQGANFSFVATAKGTTSGEPMNIATGYTAYAQMRRFYSSSTAVTLNASITGSTGEILVSLGPTGTAAIKAGTWFYDVEIHKHTGNNVQRVVQGMVQVYPEVTKIP